MGENRDRPAHKGRGRLPKCSAALFLAGLADDAAFGSGVCVQAGTYALCTDCGVGIPSARLNAYPTAKRCIVCQTRKEQGR